MVNSSSFDAAGRGDRNAKAGCTQPHKASSSCDATQATSSCNTGFSSQTADEPTPSQAEVDGVMAVIENNSEPYSDDNKSDEKTSLCCSVPLDKVQGVLAPFHQFSSEEDATTTLILTATAKSKPTRKLLCLYCDRSFVSTNLRQKHVERIHSIKRNRRVSSRRQNQLTATPCIYCDKLNSTENTLKDLFRHLITEHSSKYFGCLPCEDRFLSSSLLADHDASNHQTPISSDESSMSVSTTTESSTPEEDTTEESETRDDEVSVKITRSRMKPHQNPEESDKDKQIGTKKKSVKLKELRNKKLTVKSSKIALKRRESKRLQAIAKLCESQKKKRPKPAEKKPATVTAKPEQTNSTKSTEKAKPSSSCINPYPEFDSFYRVKKITDHSIDNLKISSLTFDDVFDKAFFNRIKCNIEENLLHHIDGKLFKNEESESRISNFEKVSNISQEIQNSASENYGCEISLNAVTPVASLSLNSQFGEDFESQIEYGSKPSKKKTQTKTDEVHYKYFTRRKYQASILEYKENRDLSKLDMWTQLVIKKRQQKMLDQKKTAKEMLEYTTGDEYKSKMKREELNRILDRRGPFEDLREEASKKAALDKLNSASEDSISHESFTEIQEVLNEILNRVFATTDSTDSAQQTETDKCSNKKQDLREIPAHLELRRTSSLPSEEEIDQSDRITLICSSQETENFELPTNQVRDKNELIELSGEWARRRMYICAACGAKLPNVKYLLEHKNIYHQNVWVQHYEFVGNQSDLYRHLSIPALGKVGVIEESVPYKVWRRSDARLCTKCGKQCNSLGELHRHILECGGDWTWMLARKKCRYKPFGTKSRRKRRGLVHRVHVKRKTEPTEKKKYKKPFEGPRQRPSDADTIQRMLANLPAKRSTRKLISLQEGIYRARKKTQMNSQLSKTLNKKKVKCGKVIYQSSNLKENTEKTVNTRRKLKNSAATRRTLRSITTVLSSRIIDTNTKLTVRRKLKALNERRRTRQSQPAHIEETEEENEKESPPETTAAKSTSKNNPSKEAEEVEPSKRISPRSSPKNVKKMTVKKLLTGKINIKSFFPVKKHKKTFTAETQTTEEQPATEENVENKTRSKKKFKENSKNETPKTEEVKADTETENVEENKTKNNTIKKLVRTLSINKKKKVKKLNKDTETCAEKNQEIPNSDEPSVSSTETLSTPIESTNENEPINGKKRKLKNAVGSVLQKVKKLKTIHTKSESAMINDKDKSKETFNKDSFLDKGKQNDKLDPRVIQEKIVIPSNLETKENIADITETVSTVSETKEENPPIPETMFKLESSNEKSLQAKGALDFDTQPVTNVAIITDTQETVNAEENQLSITEVIETEKLPDKMQPISIETSVKPKIVPLVSPNMKGKIHKPSRGLNDCIAMLTSKLQQKTNDHKPKIDGVLDLSPTGNMSRPVTDLALPKMDCILKIPTFKTHNVEETALDLSMKSKSNSSQKIENVFTSKSEISFAKDEWKPPIVMSTIEQTIEDVIGESFLPLLPVKPQSTWNSVDEIIQTVIDEYKHKTTKEIKGLNVSRNSIDDIIDFVIENSRKMNEEFSVLEEKLLSNLISTKSKSKSAPNLANEIIENKITTPTVLSVSNTPEEKRVKYDSVNSAKNQDPTAAAAIASNNQDPVKKKKRGRPPKVIVSPQATEKNDALCNKNEQSSQIEKPATETKIPVVTEKESKNTDAVEVKEIRQELTPTNSKDESTTEETGKIAESLNKAFVAELKPIKATVNKGRKGPRKIGQIRNRSLSKRNQVKLPNETPPIIETNVDNIFSFEEIKTGDVSTSVATHVSKDAIGQDIKLSNEDEPHLLENKMIIAEKKSSPQPSDSEDDLPLATLINKVGEKTAETVEVQEEQTSVNTEDSNCNTENHQEESVVENVKTAVETDKQLDIAFQTLEKAKEGDIESIVEELKNELEKSETEGVEETSANESGLSKANVIHVNNGQYKEVIDSSNQNVLCNENNTGPMEENITAVVNLDNIDSQQNVYNGQLKPFDNLQKNIEKKPMTIQRGRKKSRNVKNKQSIPQKIVEETPDIPKAFNDSQNGLDYDQMSDISTHSSFSILEESSNSVMSSSETDGVFKTPLNRIRKIRKAKNKSGVKRSKSLGDESRTESSRDDNLLERSVSLNNIPFNDAAADSNRNSKCVSETSSISNISIDNLQVQLLDISKSPKGHKTNLRLKDNPVAPETTEGQFEMIHNNEVEEKETQSKTSLQGSSVTDESPVIPKVLDMLQPKAVVETADVPDNLRMTRRNSRSLTKSNSVTDISESSNNSFLESSNNSFLETSSDLDASSNQFSDKFSDRTDSDTADSSDYLSTQSTPQKPKRIGRKHRITRKNQTRKQLTFQSKTEAEQVPKVIEDVPIAPVVPDSVDFDEEPTQQNKMIGTNGITSPKNSEESIESPRQVNGKRQVRKVGRKPKKGKSRVAVLPIFSEVPNEEPLILKNGDIMHFESSNIMVQEIDDLANCDQENKINTNDTVEPYEEIKPKEDLPVTKPRKRLKIQKPNNKTADYSNSEASTIELEPICQTPSSFNENDSYRSLRTRNETNTETDNSNQPDLNTNRENLEDQVPVVEENSVELTFEDQNLITTVKKPLILKRSKSQTSNKKNGRQTEFDTIKTSKSMEYLNNSDIHDNSKSQDVCPSEQLGLIQQNGIEASVAIPAPIVKSTKRKSGRQNSKSKNKLNIISPELVVSPVEENFKPVEELQETSLIITEISPAENVPQPIDSSFNILQCLSLPESNNQNSNVAKSTDEPKSTNVTVRKRKSKNKSLESSELFLDSVKVVSNKTDEPNEIVKDQSIRRPRSARNKQITYTEINETDDDQEDLSPVQNKDDKKGTRSRSGRRNLNSDDSSELNSVDTLTSTTLEIEQIQKPLAISEKPRRFRSRRKISNVQQETAMDGLEGANDDSNIQNSAEEATNATEVEEKIPVDAGIVQKPSEEDSNLKEVEDSLDNEICEKNVLLENHTGDSDKTVSEDKKEPIKLIINKQKTRRKSKSFRKLGQNDLFKDFALVIKKPKRIQPIITFTSNENFMKNTYPNYLKKSEVTSLSIPFSSVTTNEIKEKPDIDQTELDASMEEMDMELDYEIPITSNIIERNDLNLPNIAETMPSDDISQNTEPKPFGVTVKLKNKRNTKRKSKGLKNRKGISKHSKVSEKQDKLDENVNVDLGSLSDMFITQDSIVEKATGEVNLPQPTDILQSNSEIEENVVGGNNFLDTTPTTEKVEADSNIDEDIRNVTSTLVKTPNKKSKIGKRKSKDTNNVEVDVSIDNDTDNVDKEHMPSEKEENLQRKDIDSIYAFSESEDLEIEKPIIIPRRLPRKSNVSLEAKEKHPNQEFMNEGNAQKQEIISQSPSLRRKSNTKRGQMKCPPIETDLELETHTFSEGEELPVRSTSRRRPKLTTDLTSFGTKEQIVEDPMEQEKLSIKIVPKRKGKHNKEPAGFTEFDVLEIAENEDNNEIDPSTSKPSLRRRSNVQKEETSDVTENKLEVSDECIQPEKLFLKPNSKRKPKVTESIEKQEPVTASMSPENAHSTDVDNVPEVLENTVDSKELPQLKSTSKQRSKFNKESTAAETDGSFTASEDIEKETVCRIRSKDDKELIPDVSNSSNSLIETSENSIEQETSPLKLSSRRKSKLSKEVTLDVSIRIGNNDISDALDKREEELSLKPSSRRRSKVSRKGNSNNFTLEEKDVLNTAEDAQTHVEDTKKELSAKIVSRKKSKSNSEIISDDSDLMNATDHQSETERNDEELISDDPKILDTLLAAENDNQEDMQKSFEDLVSLKPKKKSKSTREVTLDDIQENLSDGAIKENNAELEEGGRRKSMRSAKVKALEHIHDEALAELTDSERNRDFDKSKIQIEENSTTDMTNKKNATKKSKKSQKMQKLIDNFEFPKILDEGKSPLFADLVVDLADLEELENSIERELNAEANEEEENETKYPDQELEFPRTNTSNFDESALQDNQELRRSRRGSRKVTSYNENDLIDPLLDIIDGKKKNKRKEPSERTPSSDNKPLKKAAKEAEEKLNNDQLFDLLKSSTSEQMYVPKTQNSFLNNIEDSSRDFNVDDNLDSVFKNAKSTVLDQATIADKNNKDKNVENVYDFRENSEDAEQTKMPSHLDKKKGSSKTTGKRTRSPSKPAVDETLDSTSDSREPIFEENIDSAKANKNDSNYCDICHKSFIRIENLIKHKRTLTHIQKLSELEAKEAEEKSKLEQVANESNNDSESHPEISKASDVPESDINIHNILLDSEKPRNHSQMVHSSFTNNDSLKLVDIISDVLNKPVISNDTEEHGNFIPLQNNEVHQEFKRYKSLGERKSFDSDNIVIPDNRMLPSLTEPYISKTTILEKQISLLENIIENQAGVNYIDDISMSSNNSAVENSEYSSKNDKSVLKNDKPEPSSNEESFLKPSQYEEISEDSVNLRNYEEQKLRKTLNRDEELFLECCSLLKSGSEVSSYSNQRSQKVSNSLELKQYDEPESMEKKRIVQSAEFVEDDYSDDNSRIPTPLGDSYDDDASDSNTISSNWDIHNMAPVFEKEEKESNCTFQEVLSAAVQNGTYGVTSKIVLRKTQDSISEESDEEEKKPKEIEDGATDFKKIITKGARKVFEGLKVSIPTEELNLDEVLNCSPKAKKLELSIQNTFSESAMAESKDSPAKPRTSRKSKPVKKAQVGSNLLFKMNKKKLVSPTLITPSKKNKDDSMKSYDVYDFEETQDNTDVFTKPDFKTFRAKKPDDTVEPESDNESRDGYLDSFVMERESVTSSVSSSSSLKKPKAQENITKKKCMIMGRIFKSQARSKLEDIDEEMREIPVLDNDELVENYVANCKKIIKNDMKPKLSEKEINQLFDQLLENKITDKEGANSTVTKTTTKSKQEIKKGAITNKKKKVKNRKRPRTNSDSTDDEFSLNKTTKRGYKKNGKAEDNCINLEQELKECIGVASRKSQRKCTSGKQNVLVEYWSSDDSQFEALLESQRIDIKPKQQNVVTEKIVEEITDIPVEEENKTQPTDEEKIVHTIKTSKPKNPEKRVQHRKKSVGEKKEKVQNPETEKLDTVTVNRRKRAAANPLYHWSSSSEDESHDLIELKPLRDELDDEEDRPIQHGWIVGDSPKKLVTMLAQAKGKKTDIDCVKEQGKKRTNAVS